MQPVFYITLGIISSVTTSLSYKLGAERKEDHPSSPALLCGMLTAMITLGYLPLAFMQEDAPSFATVACAALGGSCYFVAAFCYLNALHLGPFSITAALLNFSALMPTVYSLFFLKGQTMQGIQFVGFVLLVISVVLLATSKETSAVTGNISSKWLAWIIPMFFTNSLINFASRLHIYISGSGESFWYTALSFGFAFLLSVITFVVLGGIRVIQTKHVKAFVLPAICLAASLGMNMLCHLRLPALNIPAVIHYPVVSGASTVLAMILGLTFFRDRIRFYGYIALAGGVAAMVLLNI